MTDGRKISGFGEGPLTDRQPRDVWLRRCVFVALCVLMIVVANVPPALASFGFQNDKLNHALALAVMTPLAIWALPDTSLITIFVGLALFAAGIEVSQAVLELGRTPSFMDWLTGALASLVLLALANSRTPRKTSRH